MSLTQVTRTLGIRAKKFIVKRGQSADCLVMSKTSRKTVRHQEWRGFTVMRIHNPRVVRFDLSELRFGEFRF